MEELLMDPMNVGRNAPDPSALCHLPRAHQYLHNITVKRFMNSSIFKPIRKANKYHFDFFRNHGHMGIGRRQKRYRFFRGRANDPESWSEKDFSERILNVSVW